MSSILMSNTQCQLIRYKVVWVLEDPLYTNAVKHEIQRFSKNYWSCSQVCYICLYFLLRLFCDYSIIECFIFK